MSNEPRLADAKTGDAAFKGNLGMVADVARSFRRVRGDETYGNNGTRTLWHQGKLRTDLLSWETRQGVIVRQELSFFGLVVDYRQGHPLRTGHIRTDEATTDPGTPRGNMVDLDPQLSRIALEYASHLLRNVPERDFFAQHLLKHINDTLNAGFEESHTVISGLESYAKELPETVVKTHISVPHPLAHKAANRTRMLAIGLLVLSGLVLGLGLGALLW